MDHFVIPILLLLIMIITAFSCTLIRSTGKKPSEAESKAFELLTNYHGGQFQNIDIPLNNEDRVRWTALPGLFFNRPGSVKPEETIPYHQSRFTDIATETPQVVWLGHSTFLILSKAGNVLIDPNLSGFAGPIPGLVKAFKGSNVYSPADLPEIDALIISHDHYDHLDYRTVVALREKIKQIVVPLGVGSHFRYWKFDPLIIDELNWNDCVQVNSGLKITATPARHVSGRGGSPKKTLWASFVINIDGYRIFFSGDSGYGSHYKMIGQDHGPFDLALLECGQYNKNWPVFHQFPEETAQAAADLNTKMIIPAHWAKFAESNHPWKEPIQRLIPALTSHRIPLCTPMIGEIYQIGSPAITDQWWNRVK